MDRNVGAINVRLGASVEMVLIMKYWCLKYVPYVSPKA